MEEPAGALSSLGIDAGTLYLKIVHLRGDEVQETFFAEHGGRPLDLIKRELPRLQNGDLLRVGVTGALARAITEPLSLDSIETESCIIHAVKRRTPEVRNIIDIGGATLTLIRLNAGGELEGISRNSLCAAGTGSFLDEQAVRLGISYDALDTYAPVENPPPIATRCAVFAKSDLIHHQQQGKTRTECWSGLCQGMVRTLLNTLLKGRQLQGLTAVVGGVTLTREIVRRLKSLYGERIVAFEDGHLVGARGAALLATELLPPRRLEGISPHQRGRESRALATRPALRLARSRYPSWDVAESCTDGAGNEVRVSQVPGAGVLPGWLGIDIGSTSTKLVFADRDGRVVCDLYRKTGGDPLQATRLLFAGLQELGRRMGFGYEVLGCATTGSGRKMVGMVIGADRIVNEITCHVTGAAQVDPDIDTIFEIGGQDSNNMRKRNGKILDVAMNYVSAAWT